MFDCIAIGGRYDNVISQQQMYLNHEMKRIPQGYNIRIKYDELISRLVEKHKKEDLELKFLDVYICSIKQRARDEEEEEE